MFKERLRGHIGVCFLALVVESALQRLLRGHGCQKSVARVIEAVKEVRAVKVQLDGQLLLSRTACLPWPRKPSLPSGCARRPRFSPSLSPS